MDKNPNTRSYNLKTSTALCNLSDDITEIINTHFAQPASNVQSFSSNSNVNRRQVVETKIWLAIILTLSKKMNYQDNLLYNNWRHDGEESDKTITAGGQTFKVNPEAVFYVNEVLIKRPQLINRLGRMPTAIHQLLECYLKQSWNVAWLQSAIERFFNRAEHTVDIFFKPVADILSAQRKKLGDNYSKVSASRLAEFGPYCLTVNDNLLYVAEELTLADVITAIPAHIKPQDFLRRSKITDEPNSAERLKGVIDALNARYGLLVSCGLDPKKWLHQYDDEEKVVLKFADQELRQLAKLIKNVKTAERSAFKTLAAWDEATCFKTTFNELKAMPKIGAKKPGKTYAGFETAEQCYQFYTVFVKAAVVFSDDENIAESDNKLISIINMSCKKTEDIYNAINLGESAQASFASEPALDQDDAETLLNLPDVYPGLFNPVTEYTWKFINDDIENAGLHGKQALYFLKNSDLKQVIKAHPQLGYADLSDQQLLIRLRDELVAIITQQLAGDQDDQ